MTLKKILLVHKKSAFELFGGRRDRKHHGKRTHLFKKEKEYFVRSHKVHYETLTYIENVLAEKQLKFKKVFRDSNVNYNNYDFIITVGGDGTFLKALEKIGKQPILGVNSATEFSVGKLCHATRRNFKTVLNKILNDKYKIDILHRIKLSFSTQKNDFLALNDCLIAHANPADMSRYLLQIGQREEKQRSSGIWVSTAVGSTGAIKSAGGRILKTTDKKFQYKPRELYTSRMAKYRFKGGVLAAQSELKVTSLMHDGHVYIDGARVSIPFPFGSELRIQLSNKPIRSIKAK